MSLLSDFDVFSIHSGDVLLTQADSLLSLLAYHLADISHVHVAVAIWATQLNPLKIVPRKCEQAKLYVWETDPISRYDRLSLKNIIGCRLVSFEDFIAPAISVKIRQISTTYDVCHILEEHIKIRHGRPFPKGRGLSMIKAVYEYYYEIDEKDVNKRHLYCTELTAEYLNEVMKLYNLPEVADLHMATPLWFNKNGPFTKLFIDTDAYVIHQSNFSLRSRVIYCAVSLLILVIIAICYAAYNSPKEKRALLKQN